ncbi:efflux RND transporter periplasmic adaptor subunit [Formosa sp. S-31]|uniref:efflux RND transporter periplasmic adaptor subunit n=1 Tax=Formosa sp. S-31 TaxID=2790949 RepID=UPI003EBF96B9
MSKIKVLSLLLVIISCTKSEDKILPQTRMLTESVYASVTIQPDSLYQVYAMVSGILDKNLVEEGQLVSKNEDLIQIINNTPELNTRNAKLALEQAKDNYFGDATALSAIQDQIGAAQLKYRNDSINFFRQKRLWEQQIGSQSAYDTKKLNYELSLNNLRTLQDNYNRTKNELQTVLKQAENNYQMALINTKDFTVKSAIQGKVYALNKNPGEIVTTMEPLASIGSAEVFLINMLVDEVDIVKVSLNQSVVVSLDAYKEDVFTAKVSKIYPKKDERNQTFVVEAVFDTAPATLYPGLSGEANIIIAEKENALTIPKSYLIQTNQVKTDNGIITIQAGLQSMEFVEVLSGLSKDTYIYKPE